MLFHKLNFYITILNNTDFHHTTVIKTQNYYLRNITDFGNAGFAQLFLKIVV